MKLVAFSVENYRSITTTRRIALSNYSILIGANNEGKSNILHALALGMSGLTIWVDTSRSSDGRMARPYASSYAIRSLDYDWETDFPVGKQDSAKKEACTRITLEFQLNESELLEFREEIKSTLNGTLRVILSLGRGIFELSILKPGKGHAALNSKSDKIAAFVADRLRFDYIPAVRTADSADIIISKLVERELKVVEEDPRYIAALETIEALQSPVFSSLSKAIKDTVKNFLPAVTSVVVQPIRETRRRALRQQIEILVNDGNLTKLSRKGDGIQSLAALALMQHATGVSNTARNRSVIIAIEEPESHLHPKAIHELRLVIESLATNSQVVLTTHSPLFVRSGNLSSTIIVSNSRAEAARKVSDIRDVLGVRFSDNLQNARLVLIVEGKHDVKALRSILTQRSDKIRIAFEQEIVTFDDLGGASSLSQKASFYQSSACEVHAFLDNDSAGKQALDKAIRARSINAADVNLSIIPGRSESELEDLYELAVYRSQFLSHFGVDLNIRVAGRSGKWSDLTGRKFLQSGKNWDDDIKANCKIWLSNFASENSSNILRQQTEGPIIAFVESIERKIASF